MYTYISTFAERMSYKDVTMGEESKERDQKLKKKRGKMSKETKQNEDR